MTSAPYASRERSTKERILGAAEALFATHGFAGASLRQVTAAARVNLAAVNYHFGSKDKLIEEVFRRLAALAKVAGQESTQLEDVLDAYIRPALDLSRNDGGAAAFVRVLARAYAEHNETLRRFLSENYGHVLRQFATEFARLLPGLAREEIYWRLDIVTGALTYAMADFGIIQRKSDVAERDHRETAAEHLIRFAAAGLRSNPSVSHSTATR